MAKQQEQRKLTEKEQQRVAKVDRLTTELAEKGYTRVDVTTTIAKANAMALVWGLPFILIFGIWFILRNGVHFSFTIGEDLIFLALLLISIPAHEGIHGLTWGILAPSHFKTIEFGLMKETMTPYCTCGEPLRKWVYIAGSFMPCLILGFIPSVVGVFTNSLLGIVFGIVMIMAAGGDLTVIWDILHFRADAKDVIFLDHPSECGFIVFKK